MLVGYSNRLRDNSSASIILLRFRNQRKLTGHEVPAMKESFASVVMGSHRFAKNGIERFKRQTNGDKK